MSAPNLPPLQSPPETHAVRPPAPRPRHDFSSQLKDAPRDGVGERVAEPVAPFDSARSELATVQALLAEATTAPSGGKVYPQSLHVVGYLSMLGTPSLAGPVPAAAQPVPAMAPEAPAAATAAMPDACLAGIDVGAESPVSPVVAAESTAASTAAATGTDDATPAIAATTTAAMSAPVRFARRSLRLGGSTVYLRDFTLDPAEAKAVLDAIRSGYPDGDAIRNAVVNGKHYSFH
jgi:hypothetical protein